MNQSFLPAIIYDFPCLHYHEETLIEQMAHSVRAYNDTLFHMEAAIRHSAGIDPIKLDSPVQSINYDQSWKNKIM